MTATIPQTINAEQRRILVRYAAGEELPDIAKATGINGDVINALVTGPLVRFDRRRAGELVKTYDRVHRGSNGGPLAESASVPVTPLPSMPIVAVRPAVRDLLDEAEATGDRYLVVRVQKVRSLLEEIRERLSEAREVAEARAEVARLEAELAAAKARLKGGRAPVSAPPGPESRIANHDEPSSATLRAWAAERGIDCPGVGRVPKAVREAWQAEQDQEAAA